MRRIVLVLSVAALMVAMVAGPVQAQEFVKPPCPKGTLYYGGYCLVGPPYVITSPDPPKCPTGSAVVRFAILTHGCALLVGGGSANEGGPLNFGAEGPVNFGAEGPVNFGAEGPVR